jgi:hypothetical protein
VIDTRAEAAEATRPVLAGGVVGVRLLRSVRENAGLWLALLASLFFFGNFAVLSLQGGDSPVQYAWVQNLFGDRAEAWGSVGPGHPIGYFFGLGLLEAPLYGLGKVLEHAGVETLGGHPIKPALVVLGTGVLLVVLAAGIIVWLLRRPRLPFAGLALVAATFGTSLVFWFVFSPGKNHPADAALFTLVLALTFAYFQSAAPPLRLIWALGATLGLSITVRYLAGAEAVALVGVLAWFRRWLDAARVAVATAVACGLLFTIPLALGTPVFYHGYGVSQWVGFYPLNPLRMLVIDHRGLFIWSPVTALALVGLVLVYRRRPAHHRFLVAAYAMGLAIILSYSVMPTWDGDWSFGQRYYTPLFPLVALGLAGLLDAARGFTRFAVVVATLAATAWSIFLCLNLLVARPQDLSWNTTVPVGASGLARLPSQEHISAGEYVWALYYHSRLIEPFVSWPFSPER